MTSWHEENLSQYEKSGYLLLGNPYVTDHFSHAQYITFSSFLPVGGTLYSNTNKEIGMSKLLGKRTNIQKGTKFNTIAKASRMEY